MRKIFCLILTLIMIFSLISCGQNLENYNVEIDSFRLGEDSRGADVIIVKYIFTNKSSSSVKFSSAISDSAYQNGETCYSFSGWGGVNVPDIQDEDADKAVKSGETVTVEVAYWIKDKTTPVDIEVTESWAFNLNENRKCVKKTFNIA